MKARYVLASIATTALLSACATAPIVPLGNDSYMISQTSAGGIFRSMSSLETDVIERANKFAASKGKVAIPLAGHASPAYPGHMPSYEYQFRLVDKDSPLAQGNALVPNPNPRTVVNVNEGGSSRSHDSGQSHDMRIYAEIEKLNELHKQGALSDTEFETQKKKLLSELSH